jgi:hypothetical protein
MRKIENLTHKRFEPESCPFRVFNRRLLAMNPGFVRGKLGGEPAPAELASTAFRIHQYKKNFVAKWH